MTDQITPTIEPTTNDDAPKVKRTRSKRESFTIGDLANSRAKQRGISSDKAAKEVRGILRANFAVVTKLDPSITKVKERANDGNRWPALNTNVRDYVLDRSKRAAANAKHSK
jgi:hypothetical protein